MSAATSSPYQNIVSPQGSGGGGTLLWVRRGCAPVLGSFGLKILGLGYPFTGNFCDWGILSLGIFLDWGLLLYSKFCNGC